MLTTSIALFSLCKMNSFLLIILSGKELEQSLSAKAMEFDPIKQHRHFCPWIASNGKPAPGWKQTLCALERLKEFVYSSETTHVSSSLIEVTLMPLFMVYSSSNYCNIMIPFHVHFNISLILPNSHQSLTH